MNINSSLAQNILSIEPRFFNFIKIKKLYDPEYDPRQVAPKNIYNKDNSLTDEGLRYCLEVFNWLKYQLYDFKESILKNKEHSEYISRKAEEFHQILDQIEDIETKLRRTNIPILQKFLDCKYSKASIEKLVNCSHNLTDILEQCTIEVLNSLKEIGLCDTIKEYCQFVYKKTLSRMNKLIGNENDNLSLVYIDIENNKISWQDFKRICLDETNYTPRINYLFPLIENLPLSQIKVLTRRYGLDLLKPESAEQIANKYSKPITTINLLEKKALTNIGMKVDALDFYNTYYSRISLIGLKRKNVRLWRYFKDKNLMKKTSRRDFKNDPYNYYLSNYNGVSRGSLARVDHSVYGSVSYYKQLYLIPVKNKEYNGDPHSFYLENYKGVTRGELAKKDPALYKALTRYNQLTLIPRKKRDFQNNPYDSYIKHHEGVN